MQESIVVRSEKRRWLLQVLLHTASQASVGGGHSALMGKKKREWQDTAYILRFYNRKYLNARRGYREFVEKALTDGRRPEFVGGGLVRSAGGWSVVQTMRRGFERLLCYWKTRELGITTVGLARRLDLAQPTVSQAVKRGPKIAEELGLIILGGNSQ